MALEKSKLAMSICEYLLNKLAESYDQQVTSIGECLLSEHAKLSDQLGQTVTSALKPCFLATDRGE